MSELGPSRSAENASRSLDVPGSVADTPGTHSEVYGTHFSGGGVPASELPPVSYDYDDPTEFPPLPDKPTDQLDDYDGYADSVPYIVTDEEDQWLPPPVKGVNPVTSVAVRSLVSPPLEPVPENTNVDSGQLGDVVEKLRIAEAESSQPGETLVSLEPGKQPLTPEQIDLGIQFYTYGADKKDLDAAGVDSREFTKYLKNLPPEEFEFHKEVRRAAQERKRAKNELYSTNPELFEGKIATELERKIFDAGYEHYAVGFNQHAGIDNAGEAFEYLDEMGGVELLGYGPNQRFLLHDSEGFSNEYPMGYYTEKIGRFVYAFPVERVDDNAPRHAVAVMDAIPEDTIIPDKKGGEVTNVKYCAGFIDGDQNFYPNPRFMKDGPGTIDEYRRDVQDTVKELHSKAEAEGRSLNDKEKLVAKTLVSRLRNREQYETSTTEPSHQDPNEELDEILSGVDTASAQRSYETQVNTFINDVRDTAAREGRPLNPEEVLQIQRAVQTVRDFRQTLLARAA